LPGPLRRADEESVDDSHITAEDLELYALGRLSESEAADVEEHFLICEYCQRALALEDATIVSIREALRK
jgi:anti-sigma factor RsiW